MIDLKEKNVVYASDDKFVPILSVSIESLLSNNSNIYLYILSDNISDNNKHNLKRQVDKYTAKIDIIDLEDIESYSTIKLNCQSKVSRTTFYRLFLAKVIPDFVDKILYIDCDTLINNNLDDLFDYSLTKYSANVIEPTAKMMKKLIELDEKDYYFNAGIMYVNLKKWREDNITNKFVEYINYKNGKISFEDQGVMNHVLKNNIDILPVKYNVTTQYYDLGIEGFEKIKAEKSYYSHEEIKDAMENPSIIHFTNSFASERPWIEGSKHKHLELWNKYKNLTAFKDMKPWKSKKDKIRAISNKIYNILPGDIKYKFIYMINGVIRPMMGL